MLDFEKDKDICKIFNMSPCVINGHVLSIKRWNPNIRINDVDFNKAMFWEQIHDLGLKTFSPYKARIIGNTIGKCVEIEPNVEATQISSMRMNVEIDVRNSLMVRFWWINSQGTERRASIKYERFQIYAMDVELWVTRSKHVRKRCSCQNQTHKSLHIYHGWWGWNGNIWWLRV